MQEYVLPSDEELAAQAVREGSDGTAFTSLVERFRTKVWRVCWRLMGNEHDAQDAAQEVFVRRFEIRQDVPALPTAPTAATVLPARLEIKRVECEQK